MSQTTGTDITITWNPQLGRGDWSMTNGGLTVGSALETAVLLSLFTDRVRSVDFQLNDGTTDPRGWWADTFEASPIGSNLWELERVKKTDQTTIPLQARDYCNAALQWLIDDGVAATVATTATWITPSVLQIVVTIAKPDGTKVAFSYAWAWQGIA
jgi:phage gp46-like protein